MGQLQLVVGESRLQQEANQLPDARARPYVCWLLGGHILRPTPEICPNAGAFEEISCLSDHQRNVCRIGDVQLVGLGYEDQREGVLGRLLLYCKHRVYKTAGRAVWAQMEHGAPDGRL